MKEKKTNKPLQKRWFFSEIIRMALIISAFLIVVILMLNLITRHNRELEVPDFTKMTVNEAIALAEINHLKLIVTDSVFMPRMRPGEIFRQNPHAWSKVKKNRRIFLTINSIRPKEVTMPSVVGYSLRQAKAELTAKELKVGKLIYISDMATNNVLGQRYKGEAISPGTMIETQSEIDLEVGISSSEERTFVPDVMGLPLSTARDILLDNSLNIYGLRYDGSVKNYADSISGFIINQYPRPSQSIPLPLGSPVILTISVDRHLIDSLKRRSEKW